MNLTISGLLCPSRSGRKPECVIYNEHVMTARQYMRDLTVIDVNWLPELAPR